MGREAEIAAEQRKLLEDQRRAAVAAGPMLRDRFRRPLMVGAAVEMHDVLPPVFVISDISPVLEPDAQPGTWRLHLSATIVLPVMNYAPIPMLTAVSYPQKDTQTSGGSSGGATSGTQETQRPGAGSGEGAGVGEGATEGLGGPVREK